MCRATHSQQTLRWGNNTPLTVVSLFLIFFASYHSLYANAPKYSNEFMSIGVGARALAMGNATSTTAYDASANYWNPALLHQLPTLRTVTLMHANYFAGIASYNFGAFSYCLDTLTSLAISLTRLGVDDIMNTTDLIDPDGNVNYDRISYFSTADYAITFSASRQILPQLSAGVNAKIIYRNVGQFADAYGFGFDLAAHYKLGNWRFGVMLRDITTTVNLWTYNADALKIPEYILPSGDTITNTIPSEKVEITLPKFTFAASYTFKLPKQIDILAEIAADITTDGQRNVLISSRFINIDPKIGIEAIYKNTVFFRMGINNAQRITDFDERVYFAVQPNMGLGLRFMNFVVDYAISNLGSVGVSRYSHIFSLSYGF
ncbi:MAG: PorV/PorQ family protein [Bacteroidales bacterium]